MFVITKLHDTLYFYLHIISVGSKNINFLTEKKTEIVKHDKDMSRMCILLLVRHINLTKGIILCTGTSVLILYPKRMAGCFNTRILFLAFTIILPTSVSNKGLLMADFIHILNASLTSRRDFVQKKKRISSNNQLKVSEVKLSHYSVRLLSNAEVQLCHFMTKFINAKERK